MKRILETLDITWDPGSTLTGDHTPVPGLVVVAIAGKPHAAMLLLNDDTLEVGRETSLAEGTLDDPTVSRRHAKVRWYGDRWGIEDLDSRNGSALDGQPFTGERFAKAPRLLRLGNSLFLPCPDITRFLQSDLIVDDGIVMGATLFGPWQALANAAKSGTIVHVTGESGVGKELAARAFHAASGAKGPFLPVNCAAIPEGVAERLLFGAVRGAYSGIDTNVDGYLQTANKGTLFLDEVAELDLAVQAKLLRVLETREVTPLGASHGVPVDLRVVSATHRDLREQVTKGRLREDLYFRLAQPTVALPPLRERAEEIPTLVTRAVQRADAELTAHVSLIEACIVRHWPGNVRELMAEVRNAAQLALTSGAKVVEAGHLRADAGAAFTYQPADAADSSQETPPAPTRIEIERALAAADGNVSKAARMLGVHRTQLRRWINNFPTSP